MSLIAGCATLLNVGVSAAQAPAPNAVAIPRSTPEAPRDADGNLMTGKPFVACGPTTGSQIGILPNSVRNTSAQNAAPAGNAGRGGGAAQTPPATPATAGRTGGGGAPANARPTTTDPVILAGMRAAVDPRGGNGGLPNACNWADNTGFTSIFDGTLKGWDGDMRFWRAERDERGESILVGISTPQAPSGNAYLTYRPLQARDFDFKADMRFINQGGGGIQYRSRTGIQWRAYAGPAGIYNNDWMLTGPQFDYWSGTNANTGQAYSENTPMGIEASRNQVVLQFGNVRARKDMVGTISTVDAIAAAVNPEGTWNHFEIVARGPVVMHFINGQLTSVLVDDDLASSNNLSGFFGFEIENTTRFEAKNVYVRKLN
ncbi:MAG: DUF1080 domain-containing protein [Vicinamibacterales bacterium]